MSNYVYSTLANDQVYPYWIEQDNSRQLPRREVEVFIKGQAGVMGKNLVTPKGVVTEVTDEELAVLEKSPQFKRHCELGYLNVSKKKTNADKAASDLNRDASSQLTPEMLRAEAIARGEDPDKAVPTLNNQV